MDTVVQGPCGVLETAVWMPEGAPRAACAVCHPHPLHGGDMHSSVVFRIARGLQRAGLAVARFNFRGVGRSAGEHDGHGGEEEDLAAVLDDLAQRVPGAELWAAGYSFGARTAGGLALRDARIRRLVLVALPVLAFPCEALAELERPGFLVMAGADPFGTLADLRGRLPTLAARLDLAEIDGADHFFSDRTLELEECVRAYADDALDPTDDR